MSDQEAAAAAKALGWEPQVNDLALLRGRKVKLIRAERASDGGRTFIVMFVGGPCIGALHCIGVGELLPWVGE